MADRDASGKKIIGRITRRSKLNPTPKINQSTSTSFSEPSRKSSRTPRNQSYKVQIEPRERPSSFGSVFKRSPGFCNYYYESDCTLPQLQLLSSLIWRRNLGTQFFDDFSRSLNQLRIGCRYTTIEVQVVLQTNSDITT